MNAGARVGLLGGTLDPIHVGHIDTATAARRALDLDRVDVLPSHVPPRRTLQPVASAYHRFAMAALAVNGVEGLAANDVELRAPGPSYTADTLNRFRQSSGLGALQVFFITGADAFAEIETWHRYPAVLDLANFVVVSRPGFPVEQLRARLPGLTSRMTSVNPQSGVKPPAGFPVIFLVDASTADVSSTEIRRRLAAGEPLTGLVPAAVVRHILRHELYTEGAGPLAADHLHDQN
jgi:nicotinate-nucleotide adenylyltransferase